MRRKSNYLRPCSASWARDLDYESSQFLDTGVTHTISLAPASISYTPIYIHIYICNSDTSHKTQDSYIYMYSRNAMLSQGWRRFRVIYPIIVRSERSREVHGAQHLGWLWDATLETIQYHWCCSFRRIFQWCYVSKISSLDVSYFLKVALSQRQIKRHCEKEIGQTLTFQLKENVFCIESRSSNTRKLERQQISASFKKSLDQFDPFIIVLRGLNNWWVINQWDGNCSMRNNEKSGHQAPQEGLLAKKNAMGQPRRNIPRGPGP